jgi:hypothetical protein
VSWRELLKLLLLLLLLVLAPVLFTWRLKFKRLPSL